MSVCGFADGGVLVHRGHAAGRHCHAPRLPLPHHGDSPLQEGLPPVLP